MRHRRGYYDVLVGSCAKYPSNVAVRHYHDGSYKYYTYSELYGACEYISQNLQQLHCKAGVIGLISDRNVLIPCVIAAAHKYSTTFMFLDPSQSFDNVFSKIEFKILIVIQNNENNIMLSQCINKKPDKIVTLFNLTINFYNYVPTKGISHKKHINEHSFIASTSGSTGEPKHIQVPVQCLQPNIDDLTKLFNITPEDVIYFSTPLTFDPSMVEILLACVNGASLLIAPEKTNIMFPQNNVNSVTFWQITPSKFFQHSNVEIRNNILNANSTLKILALGGEPLNGVKRLRELKDKKNQTRIFTLYGVTEMSCWACVAELDLTKICYDREVPLGCCLSETKVIVKPPNSKDENSRRIVLVSKTRKCVVLDKSNSNEEQNSLRFVDTGDLAEIRDGTIYYAGRTDDIIKRFGHKVNLQVIESTVMQCTKVKTCSCIWLPNPRLLVVYFSSETLSSQELSDYLKCKLDDKHWPDKIIRVDNLPMNPHGKISRQILSQMYENVVHKPLTLDALKLTFLKELNMVLSKKFVYDEIKDKDFFSLGGTSFLALSMCNKLSLTCPLFGKLVLPYLMSARNSIDEIMELSQNEMTIEEQKPRRRVKRIRSNSDSVTDSVVYKKANSSPSNPVEFIIGWTQDTGKCVDASPTLCQTGFNLYVTVGSHSGKVIVVDAITGMLQGEITLKSRIEAPVCCPRAVAPPGEAAAPPGGAVVPSGGAVAPLGGAVVPPAGAEVPSGGAAAPPCGVVGAHDGTVLCFALHDCSELWRTNVGSMVKSKAAFCNGDVYVASYDGCIRCLDLASGAIKSQIQIASQAISADLAVAKGAYILAGTLSGVCAAVAVGVGADMGVGAVAWRGSLAGPVFAAPALYDDDKYAVFAEVNGEVHCRTVEKGIKIWKYEGAKGNIFSSLYIKQVDKLKWQMIFGCHDNKVYSINIKNFQPSLHWKTQLTSPVYATPYGLSDKLILAASNDGTLCVIDSENGIILADYKLPEETFSSPAVYGDYIFIGCRNDHLYCLKFVLNL